MTTTLSLKRPERFERREKITMTDGSDFELILRQPSFEFQINDMQKLHNWSARFEKLIVGWAGVQIENDKGEAEEIGYSSDNFKLICENYPTVFNQSCGLIIKLLNDTPTEGEESLKNSSLLSDSLQKAGSSQATNTSTEKSNATSG